MDNWASVAGVAIAVVGAVVSGANAWVMLSLRLEVERLGAALRAEMRQNEDRTRTWINGSFLRAAEAHTALADVTRRLDQLEGGR